MSGLRIKRLWPDRVWCEDGEVIGRESRDIMVLSHDGVDYWTTVESPALMLRADLFADEDRESIETFKPDVPPQFSSWLEEPTPPPVAAEGTFRVEWVRELLGAGLTIRPTLDDSRYPGSVRHAVCRGEEVVGWIMPGNPARIDGDNENWAEVPGP